MDDTRRDVGASRIIRIALAVNIYKNKLDVYKLECTNQLELSMFAGLQTGVGSGPVMALIVVMGAGICRIPKVPKSLMLSELRNRQIRWICDATISAVEQGKVNP